MKKLLVPIMVLALVALAVPALASNNHQQEHNCNVSLDGKVDLNKCVFVNQVRNDFYTTTICQRFDPAARADAEAVKNDLNAGNHLYVGASDFKDDMVCSFNYFNGIGQSNQAAGSMNNQGNTVAVAAVGNAKTYASALAAVGDNNTGNNITVRYGFFDFCAELTQKDCMFGSFNGFNGIGQSNQSAGSMNNQNNVVAVAAGVVVGNTVGGAGSFADFCKDAVAVSASELALNNTCNTFCVDKATFTNTMVGSFNGFNGIGQSNQSAGNMNNQANVISWPPR